MPRPTRVGGRWLHLDRLVVETHRHDAIHQRSTRGRCHESSFQRMRIDSSPILPDTPGALAARRHLGVRGDESRHGAMDDHLRCKSLQGGTAVGKAWEPLGPDDGLFFRFLRVAGAQRDIPWPAAPRPVARLDAIGDALGRCREVRRSCMAGAFRYQAHAVHTKRCSIGKIRCDRAGGSHATLRPAQNGLSSGRELDIFEHQGVFGTADGKSICLPSADSKARYSRDRQISQAGHPHPAKPSNAVAAWPQADSQCGPWGGNPPTACSPQSVSM